MMKYKGITNIVKVKKKIERGGETSCKKLCNKKENNHRTKTTDNFSFFQLIKNKSPSFMIYRAVCYL